MKNKINIKRHKSFGENKDSLLDLIIQILRQGEIIKEIPNGCFIVDLGCGYNGKLLNSIHKKINKGLGFDLSVTSKIQPKNIRLQNLNLNNKLPLKDNSVDVVTAIAVLEHVSNPQNLLKNVYRILKPGGKLLITTPSIYSKPLLELLAYKLHIISEEEIRDHKQYFNLQSLKNALIQAKFTNNKLHYFELGLNLFSVSTK